MNKPSMISRIKPICKMIALTIVICVGLMGITFNSMPSASALPYENVSLILTTDSNPISTIFGSGTSDKVEGKVQEDVGTVKKKASELKDSAKIKAMGLQEQAEGTADQIQGKAKRDTGEVKQRVDNASSNLEKASDNLIDSVKSLFE